MKRVTLILVLLVVWSLGSAFSATPVAYAGNEPDQSVDDTGSSSGDVILQSSGEPPEGEGDPGDAGDGVGSPQDRIIWETEGMPGTDGLDELLLFLLNQIQLIL